VVIRSRKGSSIDIPNRTTLLFLIVRKRNAGEQIPDEEVIAAYPELMPELGMTVTPAVKQRFVGKDLARVRQAYADRLADLKANDRANGAAKEPQRTGA
jgi:hypothetical protein